MRCASFRHPSHRVPRCARMVYPHVLPVDRSRFSRDSQWCLSRLSLVNNRPRSDKRAKTHPFGLRCSSYVTAYPLLRFFPLPGRSAHQRGESYPTYSNKDRLPSLRRTRGNRSLPSVFLYAPTSVCLVEATAWAEWTRATVTERLPCRLRPRCRFPPLALCPGHRPHQAASCLALAQGETSVSISAHKTSMVR
jgi:hypothetical protein